MDGSQDNAVKIVLPSSADIDAAAAANLTDEQNVLITKLLGFKVVNGAQKVGLYL